MASLVVCDSRGRICPVPGLGAVGMEAGHFFWLQPADLVRLPRGSRLFTLPDRMPVGYDASAKSFIILDEGVTAVSAFLSPGYTVTHSAAYRAKGRPKILPLYSYAAVALYNGEYYAAAVKVDDDTRHDCTLIDIDRVKDGVRDLRRALPGNRLIRHLETCALKSGCAGAQNFFLGKHEGPLPSSPYCNAVCLGCISFQARKRCPAAQPRITFVPTPEEIAEAALVHIARVKGAVVSFGQGCDGEPLLVGDTIGKAIRLIRIGTSDGTININTNGSMPETIARLCDSGLDSIRISMNSAREGYYAKYYKPRGYSFKDVIQTLKIARKMRIFISLNYLTMPGFTDSRPEFAALDRLLGKYAINMIQWRNLNYDPVEYFRQTGAGVKREEVLGIRNIMRDLRLRYKHIRFGYFNRPVPVKPVSF